MYVNLDFFLRKLNFLRSRELNDFPANIVILLGGLNDCAYIAQDKNSVDELMQSMKNIYHTLDSTSFVTHFVQITLPHVSIDNRTDDASEKYASKKNEINQRIINELKSEKRILLDINAEEYHFNYKTLSSQELWSDNIHYSEKGYDKVAECIFKVLSPVFQK